MSYLVLRRSMSLPLGLLALVSFGELTAQSLGERAAERALSDALAVRQGDTLDINRGYSRTYFPAAVFYHASYVPSRTADYGPSVAGAVVISDTVIVVRSVMDLPRVWQAAAVRLTDPELRYSQLQAACRSLMSETGLLRPDARFIESIGEIPPVARRFFLKPESAVRAVNWARAARWMETGESIIWNVDLLRLHCDLDKNDALRVRLDTLVRGLDPKRMN